MRSPAYASSTVAPASVSFVFTAFGLRLGDAFLHVHRRALDQVLRFLQAQRRHLAHSLDDVDLVRAGVLEDDVELRLLLFGRRRRAAAATAAGAAIIIAGAAAVMPNSSSIFLFRSRSSRIVIPLMMSNASSTFAIVIPPLSPAAAGPICLTTPSCRLSSSCAARASTSRANDCMLSSIRFANVCTGEMNARQLADQLLARWQARQLADDAPRRRSRRPCTPSSARSVLRAVRTYSGIAFAGATMSP